MSIVVVGSVALDTIKTPFGRIKDALGGSAVYFSTSAANFASVSLVAVVGEDFPKKHISTLRAKGIDLSGLTIEKGKTFRWEGEYSWDFSNPSTIATHLNVFASFDPKLPSQYKNTKYLFLANTDPLIQAKVLKQVKRPKLIACDTMNFWIESKRNDLLKVLKLVDIFLLNEAESRQLTGKANILKAAREILKLGPKIVIIKKGEHGVLLVSKNNIFATPAFLLESIFDPTGAGDTFAGGFMGYLAKHKKYTKTILRKAIVYGSIMATFAVEDFSLGSLAKATLPDIDRRLKKFRKLTAF